jgi:adenylate cyclase class 2
MEKRMEGQREVELKIRVASLDPLRARLRSLGAAPGERGHETNLVFDDAAGSLKSTGRLLRLRQDRRCRLTFKAPVAERVGEEGLKVRREVEIEVSNAENTREILEGLGYRVAAGNEKEREIWTHADTLVCLDEFDFGLFVEIEGSPASIRRTAADLGLDPAQGITASYLDLRARLGRD